MTRLTPDLLRGFGPGLDSLDRDLIRDTGLGLRGLALAAVGIAPNHTFPPGTKVATVPMTCGQGLIPGFAESLVKVGRHLGLDSSVTENTDAAGVREAYSMGGDVVLMADDVAFIAYSTRRQVWADNAECTALGYVEALQRAAGNIAGEEVLVIGAGQVGMHAIRTLLDRGMKVRVVERDKLRYRKVVREMGLESHMLLEEALVLSNYIINASPSAIPGSMLREGAILANPGVPMDVDALACKKCRAIIHDPLAIGTSVMLAKVLGHHSGMNERSKPLAESR